MNVIALQEFSRWQRATGQAEVDFRRHAALAKDYRRQQQIMRAAANDWWRDQAAREWCADQGYVFGKWARQEIATAKALRGRRAA